MKSFIHSLDHLWELGVGWSNLSKQCKGKKKSHHHHHCLFAIFIDSEHLDGSALLKIFISSPYPTRTKKIISSIFCTHQYCLPYQLPCLLLRKFRVSILGRLFIIITNQTVTPHPHPATQFSFLLRSLKIERSEVLRPAIHIIN